jgi:hypothetical protein
MIVRKILNFSGGYFLRRKSNFLFLMDFLHQALFPQVRQGQRVTAVSCSNITLKQSSSGFRIFQ